MIYATGTSNLAQWEQILWAVESSPWPHRTILDIGAGWGKAGVLLREYLNEKPERVDAIEPNLELRNRLMHYDSSWPFRADELGDRFLSRYDTVLLADVIEHLPKDEGVKLLDRIPGQIIVSTPLDADVAEHIRLADEIPELERHVSQWSIPDFDATGRFEKSWVPGPQFVVRLGPAGERQGRG